jgi:hypothetical protein
MSMKKCGLGIAEKADSVADNRHCGRAATPGSGLGGGRSLRLPLCWGSRVHRFRFWVEPDDKSAGPGSGAGSYGTRILSQTCQSFRLIVACTMRTSARPSATPGDGSGSRLFRM